MKVDLNSDLGESFGAYTIGMDKEVIPLVTSANIACGFMPAIRRSCRKPLPLPTKTGLD